MIYNGPPLSIPPRCEKRMCFEGKWAYPMYFREGGRTHEWVRCGASGQRKVAARLRSMDACTHHEIGVHQTAVAKVGDASRFYFAPDASSRSLRRCTSTVAWRRRSTSRASARWSPSTDARRPRSAQHSPCVHSLVLSSACLIFCRGRLCCWRYGVALFSFRRPVQRSLTSLALSLPPAAPEVTPFSQSRAFLCFS